VSRIPLRFIPPQLATSVDQPPEGSDWIHEIKHDGYRCQVLLERGQVRVFTRNGHDWTDRYPSIVLAAANLRCKSAIIDGEAIVQNGEGASDFEALSVAMRWRPNSIILYAFDIMHLNGRDLRRLPLSERRSSGQTLAYVYGHADKHGIKEGGMLELMLHRGSVARDDSLNLRSSPREA
jgi:ATP-dependent DNA ligase